MNNVYVYIHKRLDNEEIFYVGIGLKYRSNEKKGRSLFWHKVVNKYGYSIDIIAKNLPRELACNIEKSLIKYYGKRVDNTGTLVNFTDGGEGICGLKHSEYTKKLISANRKGKNLNNGWLPKNKNRAKKILDVSTMITYNSIHEAALSLNMKRQTLNAQLRGQNANKTNLIYKE